MPRCRLVDDGGASRREVACVCGEWAEVFKPCAPWPRCRQSIRAGLLRDFRAHLQETQRAAASEHNNGVAE